MPALLRYFYAHFFCGGRKRSGILLAMTFDCYVAVCTPLRYSVILTPMVTGKMALAIWGWSLGTISLSEETVILQDQ